MTLTDSRGIDFVRGLGIERVILARELTIDHIREIAGETAVPLEVFVHGALCVAYSGQCLTSEALGGRSANRGQCAQACRLPYDLIVDGERRDLGDRAYLLSPKDLAAYDLVGDLADLGVVSLKIEGRLKSADYVAVTTKTYREAIDSAAVKRPFEIARQDRLDLEQSFSRGFSHGFLGGIDHQTLVEGRFPKSRGVRLGKVVDKTPRGLIVELDPAHTEMIIRAGDGVVFDEGHPEQDEQGGRIFFVIPESSRRAEIQFGNGSVNLAGISVGSLVWRTDDPRFQRRIQQTYQHDRPAQSMPLVIRLTGSAGAPLHGEARDPDRRTVTAEWPGPLQLATKHPLSEAVAAEQLGRLGDTRYRLDRVELALDDAVMVPKSVLNQLRRDLVTQLDALPNAVSSHRIEQQDALAGWRRQIEKTPTTADGHRLPYELHVLVRTMDQLVETLNWQPEAALARPTTVYCDFEDVRRYREAVTLARAAGMPIGLATLRVLKPGETGLLSQIARAEPDLILIRNLSAVQYFQTHPTPARRIGDYSLNAANELTADLLFHAGLERLVPSYDLNWEQLAAMLKRSDATRYEVVVHQHLPMFHMEHCVFAALLSTGKDWRDCGRPCDHHRVELRDRVGAPLPLLPDTGCRNTVFNAVAQSAAQYIPLMQQLHIRHFRVELLRETGPELQRLLTQYARVLAGLETGQKTWRQLQVLDQLGVTRGTLHRH